MYHLGILGFLGKGKTRCSSKSMWLIPPGISGSSCRGPSWLPSAHSDGLCEDPHQAVLEKKASGNCHGTGKAGAVLSVCLLQMLGIWSCPESSKIIWLRLFGEESSWSRECGKRLTALPDNSLAELDWWMLFNLPDRLKLRKWSRNMQLGHTICVQQGHAQSHFRQGLC